MPARVLISEFLQKEIPKLIRAVRRHGRTVANNPERLEPGGDASVARMNEAVHDFRVNVRRLRCVFKTVTPVYGNFFSGYFRTALKKIQDATGELRDVEVLADHLQSKSIRTPPADAPESGEAFLERLQAYTEQTRRREKELRSALRKQLNDDAFLYPLKQLEALLVLPVRESRDREAEVFALEVVQKMRDRLQKKVDRIAERAGDAPWLHALRIDCKHIRYVTEFYRYVLPPSVQQTSRFAKKMQNKLGDLHDYDFILELIDAQGEELGPELREELRMRFGTERESSFEALSAKLRKEKNNL